MSNSVFKKRYDQIAWNDRPRQKAYDREIKKRMQIIHEITEFKSPIDHSMITNRRQLREHERRHNVRQIGNDYVGNKPKDWDTKYDRSN
jgi:hypothetical protein